MPAYVVVNVEVHDQTRYEEYKTLAPSSIAAHGGRYLARGGSIEVLEGSWDPRAIVVVEFPDMATARTWYASPEYAEALEGEYQPRRFVILEFPTAERARTWWACEEYARAKALRQASATTDMILVEGLAPKAPA